MANIKYRDPGTGEWKQVSVSAPGVPDWAMQPDKPTYTAEEVGARPDSWTPTATEVGAVPAEGFVPASNPNLLDNAHFANPVNQRGQTYYNQGYTVDRWKTNDVGVSVDAGHLYLVSDVPYGHLEQYLDAANKMAISGKTVTMSFNIEVFGTTNCYSEMYVGSNRIGAIWRMHSGINTASFTVPTIRESDEVRVVIVFESSAMSINLFSAKLEHGSVSTLANDHAPNFTEEFIKCVSSTADPTDTYANKPYAPASNPNLLDNPWFTVNQRDGKVVPPGQPFYVYGGSQVGTTDKYYKVNRFESNLAWITVNGGDYVAPAESAMSGYAEYGYSMDRWQTAGGGTVTVEDNGVRVVNSSAVWSLWQTVSDKERLYEKQVTFSVNCTEFVSGGWYIVILRNNEVLNFSPTARTTGILSVTTTIPLLETTDKVLALIVSEGNQLFRSAKLEYGSVSTLANDHAPDYATELLKCQRYIRFLKGVCFLFSAQSQAGLYRGNSVVFDDMRETPSVLLVPDESGNVGIVQGVSFIQAETTDFEFLISKDSFAVSTANANYAGMQAQFNNIMLIADL